MLFLIRSPQKIAYDPIASYHVFLSFHISFSINYAIIYLMHSPYIVFIVPLTLSLSFNEKILIRILLHRLTEKTIINNNCSLRLCILPDQNVFIERIPHLLHYNKCV